LTQAKAVADEVMSAERPTMAKKVWAKLPRAKPAAAASAAHAAGHHVDDVGAGSEDEQGGSDGEEGQLGQGNHGNLGDKTKIKIKEKIR
jgi:hypothetical protein